jgi:uncharacterized protein involved in outer membrane biogenesis
MKPQPTSPAPNRRPWRRRLLLAAAAAPFLLVLAWFVVTSNRFLQIVVLPRVARTLGAQVSAQHVTLHPFSSLELRQLKLVTTDPQPVLTLEHLRLRYRLRDLLSARPSIESLEIISPILHITRLPDGTSNLDPLLTSSPPSPTSPTPSSTPTPFLLRQIIVTNGFIHFHDRSGAQPLNAQLSQLHLHVDQFGHDSSSEVNLATTLKVTVDEGPTQHELESHSIASLAFHLGPDLLPTRFTNHVEHQVRHATGRLAPLDQLRLSADASFSSNTLHQFSLVLTRHQEQLGALSARGTANPTTREINLQFEIPTLGPNTLNALASPWNVDLGETSLDAHVQIGTTRNASLISLAARANASALSVRAPELNLDTPPLDLQLGISLTADLPSTTARITTFTLQATQNRRPLLAGKLNRSLDFNWTSGRAGPPDATLELTLDSLDIASWSNVTAGFAHSGIARSTLTASPHPDSSSLQLALAGTIEKLHAPLGTDYQLYTDATFTSRATLASAQSAAFSAQLDLNRTVLEASTTRYRGQPLRARAELAGQWHPSSLEITNGQLSLPPTPIAPTNRASFTTTLLFPTADRPSFDFHLASPHLDITPLYDAAPLAPTPTTPASTPTPQPPVVNPDPFVLPIDPSSMTLTAERLDLRQLVISNLNARAELSAHQFQLTPTSFSLNGAPVSAGFSLDFSQPGWAYTASIHATGVPFEPLANSFMPDARGRYRGDLDAQIELAATGFTGPLLQQSLQTRCTLTFTNAQLHLLHPKTKQLLTPLALALGVTDIDRAPLNWLTLQAHASQGVLHLDPFSVQSAAFQAHTRGNVQLAPNPADSQVNLPLDLRLPRNLAAKARLLPANTPPDASYVPLPQFASIKGTLADPKTDIDQKLLAGLLLKSGLGIAEQLGVNLDNRTGTLLQGVGNLLSGDPHAAPSTNAPSSPTNALSPANTVSNLLDLLRRRP